MIGFEISINEMNLKAGISSAFGVLTSIISWQKRKAENVDVVNLSVIGTDSENKNQLEWLKQDLKVGDTITFKIIEDENFDPPTIIMQAEQVNDVILQSKLKYFFQLKEELKDHI